MKLSFLSIVILGCASAAGAQGPTLAPGYTSTVFHVEPAGELPTGLCFDGQGRLYLCTMSGKIRVLEDTNGDRVADQVTQFWDGTGLQPPVLGIVLLQGSLFVSHLGTISRLDDVNGDLMADARTDLVTGLPNGLHQNNGLFTDGTSLYFGLGSLTDHDGDPDPRSATIMRMGSDGTGLSVFATGLRNVFDGVVHPVTGHVFAGDNGPNLVPGNPDPPDELNWVREGLDYGHPTYWGNPPMGTSTVTPLLELPSHASPTGMDWNPCTRLSGYPNEIVMTTFGGAVGTLARMPVVYGDQALFPVAWAEILGIGFVNPIDVAVSPGGEIYVADYSVRTIYAIHQVHDARIVVESAGEIGTSATLRLAAPGYPSHQVFAAASTALDQGMPLVLAPGVQVNLDLASPIFWFSVMPQNGVFDFPQPGLLDAQGETVATIHVPNDPALIGVTVQLQYTVIDPTLATFVASSPPLGFVVLPQF